MPSPLEVNFPAECRSRIVVSERQSSDEWPVVFTSSFVENPRPQISAHSILRLTLAPLLLSQVCMSASLTPFLAPAAGTIAFLLLLCVSIGAVLALSPFPAEEKLASGGDDTRSVAMPGSSFPLHGGIEAEDSPVSNRPLAKQTSASKSEVASQGAAYGGHAARETARDFHRELPAHPVHAQDPYADLYSTVRWWGINE